MSATHSPTGAADAPRVRVRQQARECMVLMSFSAAASVLLATTIVVLTGWAK